MDTLFGNIDEVIEVSQRLLTELESATAGKDFDDQLIGSCLYRDQYARIDLNGFFSHSRDMFS
jgi:hypothetical protein